MNEKLLMCKSRTRPQPEISTKLPTEFEDKPQHELLDVFTIEPQQLPSDNLPDEPSNNPSDENNVQDEPPTSLSPPAHPTSEPRYYEVEKSKVPLSAITNTLYLAILCVLALVGAHISGYLKCWIKRLMCPSR